MERRQYIVFILPYKMVKITCGYGCLMYFIDLFENHEVELSMTKLFLRV